MFAPVALAGYASLIAHGYMPSQPFAPSQHLGELPAQLEVLVSAMFTVSAWRGNLRRVAALHLGSHQAQDLPSVAGDAGLCNVANADMRVGSYTGLQPYTRRV